MNELLNDEEVSVLRLTCNGLLDDNSWDTYLGMLKEKEKLLDNNDLVNKIYLSNKLNNRIKDHELPGFFS